MPPLAPQGSSGVTRDRRVRERECVPSVLPPRPWVLRRPSTAVCSRQAFPNQRRPALRCRNGRLSTTLRLMSMKRGFGEIFERFPVDGWSNEAETEDDLIWPVLDELGWIANLRQQNLSANGSEDVPDGLLFADDASKVRVVGVAEGRVSYAIDTEMVEAKRRLRALVANVNYFFTRGI